MSRNITVPFGSSHQSVPAKRRDRAILAPTLRRGLVCGLLLCCSSLDAQTTRPENAAPSNNIQISSRTYYDGAETLGRVGHVAILRRDVLHQIKKVAHMQYLSEIEKLPEDVREERRQEYKEGILNGYLQSSELYSQILDEHIRLLLFYNDYVVSRPKEQVKEQTEQLLSEFNSKVVPDLMKQFHCKTTKELEDYYENEILSDFEQEKRIFVQQQLAILWMQFNLGEEDFTPSLADLRRYYDANQDEFRREQKIRWQCMTVYFGDKRDREDARKKIAHMGNAVQSVKPEEQEAMFAQVCRVDSEDSFASEGGYRTSTERGALKSKLLEDAIFSDKLPEGALSRVIEDGSSLMIARVIKRQIADVRPFTEVQEEVREKLIAERTEAMKKKYEQRLSARFSVEIYALTEEDRERYFRSANREEMSATGRKTIY